MMAICSWFLDIHGYLTVPECVGVLCQWNKLGGICPGSLRPGRRI